MAWQANKPQPTPGHPIARRKPYVYATWLAKLLGGNECQWSAWFKAHHKYVKFERDAEKLQEWNRDHTELMQQRRAQLEADGWTVYNEDANSFTLEGEKADVAGKPDLVAVMDDQVLLIDGKTGRKRESDAWQVRLYLWALPLVRKDLKDKALAGEVEYKTGRTKHAPVDPPSDAHIEQMVSLIRVVAGEKPPAKVPSEWECGRCDIGLADCPQRYQGRHVAKVSGF